VDKPKPVEFDGVEEWKVEKSLIGISRAYFNGKSREEKCNYSTSVTVRRIYA